MYCKRISIIGLLLLCIHLACVAQPPSDYERGQLQQKQYEEQSLTTKQLKKEEWVTLKKKLKIKEYTPEKKDIEKKKDERKWEFQVSPQLSLYLKWILFGGILIALLFLVLNVMGVHLQKRKSGKKDMPIALDELEDNLDTAAIDPHLYAAIKNKQFKLAIRLYYLMIIQQLSYKEIIHWKKYKTNQQYLKEVKKNDGYYEMLKQLTLTYEQCWFGDGVLSEAEYDRIQPAFVNFLHQLK
ncbi:MAG: hypothetical protein U0T77_02940 [Chitinophagales bacterium]